MTHSLWEAPCSGLPAPSISINSHRRLALWPHLHLRKLGLEGFCVLEVLQLVRGPLEPKSIVPGVSAVDLPLILLQRTPSQMLAEF